MNSNKFETKSIDECLEIVLSKELKALQALQLANRLEQLAPTPRTTKIEKNKEVRLKGKK